MTRIIEPGEYTFSVGESPKFNYDIIPRHLQATFFDITARMFKAATSKSGKYERAKLVDVQNWSPRVGLGLAPLYLQRDKELCQITTSDASSNGVTSGMFLIQNIGRVTVEKNEVVVSKNGDLDGRVMMQYTGTAYHPSRGGSTSANYTATVSGCNRGDIVQATIDFINTELERTNTPLYRRVD